MGVSGSWQICKEVDEKSIKNGQGERNGQDHKENLWS